MNIKQAALIFNCVITVNGALAQSLPDSATIHHDPFQKPEIVKSLESANPASPQKGLPAEAPVSAWRPKLNMTLRSGPNSMVNVGGQIIGLGEKIEGQKLIEVQERSAVFVKLGKITRLNLDENNDK